MKKVRVSLIFLICLLSFVCYAHPGRTDADGGHYDHSTGQYHYHNGESVSKVQNTDTKSVSKNAGKTPQLNIFIQKYGIISLGMLIIAVILLVLKIKLSKQGYDSEETFSDTSGALDKNKQHKALKIIVHTILIISIIVATVFVTINVCQSKWYDNGYSAGKKKGIEVGEKSGYKKGYDEGEDEGHDDGYNLGYDEGYDEGYNDGSEADNSGESYNEGYNVGYIAGYNKGKNDVQNTAPSISSSSEDKEICIYPGCVEYRAVRSKYCIKHYLDRMHGDID